MGPSASVVLWTVSLRRTWICALSGSAARASGGSEDGSGSCFRTRNAFPVRCAVPRYGELAVMWSFGGSEEWPSERIDEEIESRHQAIRRNVLNLTRP